MEKIEVGRRRSSKVVAVEDSHVDGDDHELIGMAME